MTALQPLIAERNARRSIWLCAAVTAVCVAVGATAAVLTLPSVTGSATQAATSYIEARLAGDHLKAWSLECKSTRASAGGYDGYVEELSWWDDRLDVSDAVDVAVGDLHGDPFGFTISTTVTPAGGHGRTIAGKLPLSFEDGRFRVCDDGLGPLGLL